MIKVIKKIINFFLKPFNLNIIKINSLFFINKDEMLSFEKNNPNYQLYFEGLKKSNNEKSDNYFKQSRFLDLINLVNFTLKKDKIEDFVEVGCWRGHSSYMISCLIKKNSNKNINFHIFDSFEGLSDETKSDQNLSKLEKSQIFKR